MDLAAILAAIQIFNQTLPEVMALIVSFRHPDGTSSQLTTLDKDETQLLQNISDAQVVLDGHISKLSVVPATDRNAIK